MCYKAVTWHFVQTSAIFVGAPAELTDKFSKDRRKWKHLKDEKSGACVSVSLLHSGGLGRPKQQTFYFDSFQSSGGVIRSQAPGPATLR